MIFISFSISHIQIEAFQKTNREKEKNNESIFGTWFEGYGCRENVFGIYGTKKEAEIARKSAAKQLYEKEISKTSLIEVEMSIEILELELNQAANIELGSYIE